MEINISSVSNEELILRLRDKDDKNAYEFSKKIGSLSDLSNEYYDYRNWECKEDVLCLEE